jgi:threonyl-tRNA synthetase
MPGSHGSNRQPTSESWRLLSGNHLRRGWCRRRRFVLPITDRQAEYARTVQKQLDAAGIRATLDERSEKVNFKIREAQLQKIPFMLVVGDREMENGQPAVRNRKHGDQGVKTLAEFIAAIRWLIESKAVSE